MKRIISMIFVMLFAFSIPVFAQSDILVTLNGKALFFDTPPINFEGRNLVPLRKIFEELGAEVTWDAVERKAISKKNDTTVVVQIDNNEMYINGEVKVLDVPAMIKNDRTLVPTRAVAEAFKCFVDWDNDNRTVIIKTPEFIKREEQAKDYVSDKGYKISHLDKYVVSQTADFDFAVGTPEDLCVLTFNTDTKSLERPTYEILSQEKDACEAIIKETLESETGIKFDSCKVEIINSYPVIEVAHSYMDTSLKQVIFLDDKKIYCATLIILPEVDKETIEDFEFMMYSLTEK